MTNGTQIATTMTPTEASTFYSLIAQGLIGGIGTLALAEMIKNKKEVPSSSLMGWTVLLGLATAVSVVSIARSAKS